MGQCRLPAQVAGPWGRKAGSKSSASVPHPRAAGRACWGSSGPRPSNYSLRGNLGSGMRAGGPEAPRQAPSVGPHPGSCPGSQHTRRVNKHPAFNCCHAQTCLTAPGLRCHLPPSAQHLLRAPPARRGGNRAGRTRGGAGPGPEHGTAEAPFRAPGARRRQRHRPQERGAERGVAHGAMLGGSRGNPGPRSAEARRSPRTKRRGRAEGRGGGTGAPGHRPGALGGHRSGNRRRGRAALTMPAALRSTRGSAPSLAAFERAPRPRPRGERAEPAAANRGAEAGGAGAGRLRGGAAEPGGADAVPRGLPGSGAPRFDTACRRVPRPPPRCPCGTARPRSVPRPSGWVTRSAAACRIPAPRCPPSRGGLALAASPAEVRGRPHPPCSLPAPPRCVLPALTHTHTPSPHARCGGEALAAFPAATWPPRCGAAAPTPPGLLGAQPGAAPGRAAPSGVSSICKTRWGTASAFPAAPLLRARCVGRAAPSDLRNAFRAIKGSRVPSEVPLPQKHPADEGAASRAAK